MFSDDALFEAHLVELIQQFPKCVNWRGSKVHIEDYFTLQDFWIGNEMNYAKKLLIIGRFGTPACQTNEETSDEPPPNRILEQVCSAR